MKKTDIKYEVTELTQIKASLSQENPADVEAAIIRLGGNMNDLLSEAEYADAAESILEVIDGYDRHDNTRADVLNAVDDLISTMQADYNKSERAEEFKEIRDEVKDVCGEVAGVIRRETKAACEEIRRTIKQETPKCSSALAAVKEMPRKMEKGLKRGIRNWLKDDDE